MKKPFPTLAVVGVYTGKLLEEGGFHKIHEVFDHLYPGIMTLGLSAMWAKTQALLAVQIPALLTLPQPDFSNKQTLEADLRAFVSVCLAKFGPTLAWQHGQVNAQAWHVPRPWPLWAWFLLGCAVIVGVVVGAVVGT